MENNSDSVDFIVLQFDDIETDNYLNICYDLIIRFNLS